MCFFYYVTTFILFKFTTITLMYVIFFISFVRNNVEMMFGVRITKITTFFALHIAKNVVILVILTPNIISTLFLTKLMKNITYINVIVVNLKRMKVVT